MGYGRRWWLLYHETKGWYVETGRLDAWEMSTELGGCQAQGIEMLQCGQSINHGQR